MSVYLLRHVPSRRVKIGRARNHEDRLRAIAVCCPVLEDYELVALLDFEEDGGDAAGEAALHMDFDALRLHGEWFREEGALASYVSELLEDDEEGPVSLGDFVELRRGGQSQVLFWQQANRASVRQRIRNKRHLGVCLRFMDGETMGEIGQSEQCSRQRVHQILKLCQRRMLEPPHLYSLPYNG